MTQFTDDIVRRGQFLKLGFARKWLEQQKRCVWQNNGQPACQFTEESGASNGDGHGKQANTQRGEDGRSQCAHNQGDAMVCPPFHPPWGPRCPPCPPCQPCRRPRARFMSDMNFAARATCAMPCLPELVSHPGLTHKAKFSKKIQTKHFLSLGR